MNIVDVAYDSRRVRPGTLFVAVPTVGGGPESGGIRFLSQVVEAGAAAVVLQAGSPPPDFPAAFVPDARAALADIAAAFFGHPSHELRVFAVTGTDGKTTTTYLLEHVLSASGRRAGLLGTIETRIGRERIANPDRMTTPESLDLQRLLRQMVNAGVRDVSLEASSHALALDRLRGCRIHAAALTNITADHLEFHGSWEAYFDAKSRLFTELAAGRPAVLNRDSEHFERLDALTTGPVLSYGFDPLSDLRAELIAAERAHTICAFSHEGRRVELRVPLPGRHNVSNALAATGLALAAGLDLDVMADALSSAEPPPGRMQRVSSDAPFDVIVDYAHTPNAFRSALSSLRAGLNGGRLIAVFGAAGNRDRQKRPELARIANDLADVFFITNEDPFGEDPDEIMDEIASGVPDLQEGETYRRIPDRGEAIQAAIGCAGPGDVVAILGKGHERNIAVGDRRLEWSDVEAARRALEDRS